MYYITISNGLLKDSHYIRMGMSVWLYMWFIDKVTKIDEDGTGWVFGGKPIQLKEIDVEKMSYRSIQRYLAILKTEQYIIVKYTMRGIIIGVKKVKKEFHRRQRNDTPKVAYLDTPETAYQEPKVAYHHTKSGVPNKTIPIDNPKDDNEGEENTETPAQIADDFFLKGEHYKKYLSIFSEDRDPEIVEKEFMKFILYWTEPNKSGTKVRWRMQDTFEVKRRLYTWMSRVGGGINQQNKTKEVIY